MDALLITLYRQAGMEPAGGCCHLDAAEEVRFSIEMPLYYWFINVTDVILCS